MSRRDPIPKSRSARSRQSLFLSKLTWNGSAQLLLRVIFCNQISCWGRNVFRCSDEQFIRLVSHVHIVTATASGMATGQHNHFRFFPPPPDQWDSFSPVYIWLSKEHSGAALLAIQWCGCSDTVFFYTAKKKKKKVRAISYTASEMAVYQGNMSCATFYFCHLKLNASVTCIVLKSN